MLRAYKGEPRSHDHRGTFVIVSDVKSIFLQQMRDNQCRNSGSNLRDRDFVHPSIPKSNKLLSSILSEITSRGRCDLESSEVMSFILAQLPYEERLGVSHR